MPPLLLPWSKRHLKTQRRESFSLSLPGGDPPRYLHPGGVVSWSVGRAGREGGSVGAKQQMGPLSSYKRIHLMQSNFKF